MNCDASLLTLMNILPRIAQSLCLIHLKVCNLIGILEAAEKVNRLHRTSKFVKLLLRDKVLNYFP